MHSRFHYSEQNFAIQYSDDPDPYHSEDSRIWNVTPLDWAAFSPNLGMGTISQGQQVRGTVPFDMSAHSRVLISMTDDDLTTTLAQWLTTTA